MAPRRVCVGIITKPVGIKGQVKVHPYTTSPDFFVQHTKLSLKNRTEIVLKCLRIDKNGDIVALINGIQNRTEADSLRLQELFVMREELPQLGRNEYYHEDLIGLKVVDDKRRSVGIVSSVQDYGAGAFLEIKLPNMKLATIPFNQDAIIAVGLRACEVVINRQFLLL